MRHFYKIPSLIQIVLAEIVAMIFLSAPVSALVALIFRPATGILPFRFEWSDLLPMAVGLAGFVWLMSTIFRPRMSRHFDYPFLSTHPSYVLVDVFVAAGGYFVYWLWRTEWQARWLDGLVFLGLGAVGPILRLLAWYGLGLRPRLAGGSTEEETLALRHAWKPVAHLYGWFVLPFAIAATLLWFFMQRDFRQQAYDALAVVEAASFTDRAFVRELTALAENQGISQVLRLRVPQRGAAATTCRGGAEGRDRHASVVAETDGAGDIFIAAGTAHEAELVKKAKNNGGQLIDVAGRIRPTPADTASLPSTRAYCGLADLQPRPRWLFEMESP